MIWLGSIPTTKKLPSHHPRSPRENEPPCMHLMEVKGLKLHWDPTRYPSTRLVDNQILVSLSYRLCLVLHFGFAMICLSLLYSVGRPFLYSPITLNATMNENMTCQYIFYFSLMFATIVLFQAHLLMSPIANTSIVLCQLLHDFDPNQI
jgi:hypothetical protein